MININKTEVEKFIIEWNDITITALFKKNRIYLTKKQISKLFDTKKKIIKNILKNKMLKFELDNKGDILKVFNKKKKKNEVFYSLDMIISIWYRLNSFDKAKFLVNSSLLIKNYNSKRKHNLKQRTNISNLVWNFLNYFKETTHLN